ncbi:AraC family transcriptional regulator [Paenibacillus sp. MMS20-IR301]|uniref:AraC family transcriptional regulator n=1 Tax=Paenibacillus sp. MMS20-IR301 TaxID=2895946 RepID=UPI0028EA1F30|nr:AraC family transcriptional regulator [Paenibacillus sp. MMS20-IR301]WNS45341.1 AraC family transcriptional regulator [Paenibacillus sp. MMS20-IR301]
MQRSELILFLQNHRLGNLDTEAVRQERNPESVLIGGLPVFLFNLSFDIHDSPVDESISISQVPYGTEIPLHMHNYIEMMFVYRGRCDVTVGGMERMLMAGDLLIIDKETPHAVKQTTQDDYVVNIILKQDFLSPAFLGRLSGQSIISRFMVESLISSRRHNHYLLFASAGVERIAEMVENMMCEFFERDLLSGELIDSYLLVLFSLLIRCTPLQEERAIRQPGSHTCSIIEFMQYIEANYEHCTLPEMGQAFGFHPNYLSSLLKKGTGRSFKQLLQLQRLSQASLFLTSSDLPVPDIAEQVGYSSLTFFYKKFKEIYKVTPSEYREANKRF